MNQMDRILVARQFLLLLRDFKREAWTCKTRYWNTRNSYRGRETLIEDNQWPHVHRCVSMRFNRYAIFLDDEQGRRGALLSTIQLSRSKNFFRPVPFLVFHPGRKV